MVSRSLDRGKQSYQLENSYTLVVPGLLNLPEFFDEQSGGTPRQFNELELFLARAKAKKAGLTDYESIIFDLFGVEKPAGSNLPIAPVSYLGDTGNITKDWIVRADPVHLLPNRDELILSGPETLSLTMPEAEYLVAILNEFFKEDDWRIEVATPERWYLHVPKQPNITTHNISKVLDRAIGEFLPEGPEGKQWRRAMNEVQMVLHRIDVNVQRQAENRLPVNSIWFWGEGTLPEFSHSCWSQLWSSEPISLGLAHLTRTPRNQLPVNGDAWLSQVSTPGEHLLVYSKLQHQTSSDRDAWHNSINAFQENWLNPLMRSLREGSIDQLILVPCNGMTYKLSSGGLKRWWCRKKPVYAYCS